MTGIDDVARAAGVSTATVSRALSGRGHVSPATRERVTAAADALGYVVSSSASSLASGRTRSVGVIVPTLGLWFFSTVVAGIASTLFRAGYDLTLYSVPADSAERRAVFDEFLRRGRADALIAVSIPLRAAEIDRLAELGLPIIAIGGPNASITTLTVDDVAVGRLAASHLLELGHRDIAYIGAAGADTAGEHGVPAQRRRGFEAGLGDAGATLPAERYAAADFTLDGGFRAAAALLDTAGPRPTAIFAASDEMAIGAILAARERGLRVPEDLSVIGVDGHELGGFFRLTTIDQNPAGQGERAAAAVLAELDGRDAAAAGEPRHPSPAPLPFALVVRGSTAPPPA